MPETCHVNTSKNIICSILCRDKRPKTRLKGSLGVEKLNVDIPRYVIWQGRWDLCIFSLFGKPTFDIFSVFIRNGQTICSVILYIYIKYQYQLHIFFRTERGSASYVNGCITSGGVLRAVKRHSIACCEMVWSCCW